MDTGGKNTSIVQLLLKILIWLGVIVIGVTIILPIIFILLGSACPNYFSSDGALIQLNQNVNALVGYCSLAVGICSIIYASLSNRRVDEQQQQNQVFLHQLSDKLDELQRSNIQLFDQVVNKQQDNTKKDNSQ